MNEITIYYEICKKINKEKRLVKWGLIMLMLYAIHGVIMLYLPLLDWAKYVTIFVPLIAIIVLLFLAYRKEYKIAKRFPKVYNKWINESDFVVYLYNRGLERTQRNRDHIIIRNIGLDFLDKHYNLYKDDKQKFSNALYNAIQNTTLVSEIKDYEKYKMFIEDMNSYRRWI